MREYFQIFLTFLKVGLFTFGGGYATIPVAERELINKRAWVTMDELMDFFTVSQIMPGMIGVNLSIFVGNKHKGAFAGFLGAMGFILPGVTLVTLVAIFIGNFAELAFVQHAFAGIRIAVGALILDTVIKLVKGVFKGVKTLLIYLFVFALSVLPSGLLPGVLPGFVTSPAFLVAASGFAGLVMLREKRT